MRGRSRTRGKAGRQQCRPARLRPHAIGRRRPLRPGFLLSVGLVAASFAAQAPSAAAQTLAFSSAPNAPALGTATLTGAAQTLTAAMGAWEVQDGRGSGAGWHVTVQGDGGAGKSAVFREYCSDGTATNGCDTAVGGVPGPGYVTAGASFAAGSLTLDSAGATFAQQDGSGGTAPQHTCGSVCSLDSGSAVTVASAAVGAGEGTWRAQGYGGSSLSLNVSTTTRFVGSGNKLYRIDLIWTLASGPS